MEYANLRTNLREEKFNKRSWTSSLIGKVKRHKVITLASVAFVVFSTLNFVMIFNFMKILQNV